MGWGLAAALVACVCYGVASVLQAVGARRVERAEQIDHRLLVRVLGSMPFLAGTALDAVGLGGLAGLPAAYLSAGQRRRLALARLVAAPRSIWLLDEPTAALDSAGQQRLAELMRSHLSGGGIIVAATHGPLGIAAKELRLEVQSVAQPPAPNRTTPVLAPSPQGEGERRR